MDYKEEITKLKGRVEALEALIGKNALTPPTPGATFEIQHPCGHTETYSPMIGASPQAIEDWKKKTAERDCPACETDQEQQRRIAEGKAQAEGRSRDEIAMTHAVSGRR